MCMFSLITICLNPGDKLRKTLESALCQTEKDFEVIIKDGGSKDHSLETIQDYLQDPRIKLFVEKDGSIYDGMNQAVAHASGKYVFFLNCGDLLYDENVLKKVRERILQSADPKCGRFVFYGNVYHQNTQSWIIPAPKITGFTCYRNIPCHQACFYDASLCKEKAFDSKYKIRGDYEHFLWCFYRGNAKMQYLDVPVAKYEGGGYSETKENLRRSKREHREITCKYMGKFELFKYRAIMALTLAPVRTMISENPKLSATYQKLVGKIYRR